MYIITCMGTVHDSDLFWQQKLMLPGLPPIRPHWSIWQCWAIIYLQDTRRMRPFMRSLLLLALLLQSSSERVTYTNKPLVDKFCHFTMTETAYVREHHYCHWHCMMKPTCMGVNYRIDVKMCMFIFTPCTIIDNFQGVILTVYGTEKYIRELLQNNWLLLSSLLFVRVMWIYHVIFVGNQTNIIFGCKSVHVQDMHIAVSIRHRIEIAKARLILVNSNNICFFRRIALYSE